MFFGYLYIVIFMLIFIAKTDGTNFHRIAFHVLEIQHIIRNMTHEDAITISNESCPNNVIGHVCSRGQKEADWKEVKYVFANILGPCSALLFLFLFCWFHKIMLDVLIHIFENFPKNVKMRNLTFLK
ncbi:hypothetical protein ACJX0J_033574 [Zea mays]